MGAMQRPASRPARSKRPCCWRSDSWLMQSLCELNWWRANGSSRRWRPCSWTSSGSPTCSTTTSIPATGKHCATRTTPGWLETDFSTTAPVLARHQQCGGIDPSWQDLLGERHAKRVCTAPTVTCEHCDRVIKSNQWNQRTPAIQATSKSAEFNTKQVTLEESTQV